MYVGMVSGIMVLEVWKVSVNKRQKELKILVWVLLLMYFDLMTLSRELKNVYQSINANVFISQICNLFSLF